MTVIKFRRIFFLLLITLMILSTQCNWRKNNLYDKNLDSLKNISSTSIDSNKLIHYGIPHFKYYSFDTIMNFGFDKYRIITNRKKYTLYFQTFKNEIFQCKDSTFICGYYSINMEDYDGNGYPDIQLNYRCGNNHEDSKVLLWNHNLEKYIFKLDFPSIGFIKPNYFISSNNNTIWEYQHDIYHILTDTTCQLIKSFTIRMDSISYISSKDTTIYTNNPYQVLDDYLNKIKNTP